MALKNDFYQVGLSATPGNNFVLQTDAAGGFKLSRGILVVGVPVTSQDILTADASGYVDFLPTPWVTSSPTPTPSAGALGSAVAALRLRKQGKTVQYQLSVDITSVGTASGTISIPLPYVAATIGVLREWNGVGRESRQVGYGALSWVQSGTSTLFIATDNPFNNNHLLNVSGSYESAA
ncbi:hypothetical protein [Variovorax sp. PAMC26660]|uniref:hypothetical protein n=1 Tax=Variovorax sp. PAMC26660 TaxID=2762322 RepID=UPI00164E5815|nr:hypothetical protein [Variovorax sp. PAMC26660]QNK66090.1 hypothetical protein H7F35_23200 [Variovorax sp. PAMC26660]